jgi:hypothetical protein
MAPTYQYGLCWLADPPGVYVWLFSSCPLVCLILSQIAYWLSSYPLGKSVRITILAIESPHALPSEDVVKSRIQLRTTPPKGTPVQYIAGELKAVIAESGV